MCACGCAYVFDIMVSFITITVSIYFNSHSFVQYFLHTHPTTGSCYPGSEEPNGAAESWQDGTRTAAVANENSWGRRYANKSQNYQPFCKLILKLSQCIVWLEFFPQVGFSFGNQPFCGLEKLHLFVQTVPASDTDLMLSCLIRNGQPCTIFLVPQSFVWSHTTSTSSFLCFANCI